MKKNSLLIVVLLLFSGMAAQAQLRFGVRAGVNLSQITYKSGLDLSGLYNSNIKNATGFQIGFLTECTLPVIGLGFDAAVLYSEEGFQNREYTYPLTAMLQKQQTYKVGILEIPVNLKHKITLGKIAGIYGTVGPYVSFKLSDNLQTQYYDKSFGAGLNVGLGVELLNHLQLGIIYKLGLTDNYASLDLLNLENVRAKQRTWTISAAYLF